MLAHRRPSIMHQLDSMLDSDCDGLVLRTILTSPCGFSSMSDSTCSALRTYLIIVLGTMISDCTPTRCNPRYCMFALALARFLCVMVLSFSRVGTRKSGIGKSTDGSGEEKS